MSEPKWYHLVVHDIELNKDIICMVKANSEFHAKNVAYVKGYSEVRIASESDIKTIRERDAKEYDATIQRIYSGK